jgi:epoxyqueuosine reductase
MPSTARDASSLTAALKAEAARAGFALAGACPASTSRGIHRFYQWLDAGYAGEMDYLARRRDAYEHPRSLLAGARSLFLLAMNYRTDDPQPLHSGQGRLSRYAWGEDYHDLIHSRLHRLADFLRQQMPGATVRGVVDTAPLLEREFAELAGLGWIGKNTLLLNKRLGSWFFLAALMTDVELEYDEPNAADHCGTCRACLDACPTEAFVAPYVLDSRRCISYLTIELRDSIPEELRSGVGDWLLGCDVCQDVCPWNRRAPESAEPSLHPKSGSNPVDLIELFGLDEAAFRRRFRHTPLWRPKRRGILRNAAIVLGNQRCEAALMALARGLTDVEPLVRGACAWALGQYDSPAMKHVLQEQLASESDDYVRGEIEAALRRRSIADEGLDAKDS